MNSPLWFIELLREHPLIGFAIGLLFAGVMFGSKNLVIYLYDRHRRRSATASIDSANSSDSPPAHRTDDAAPATARR